MNAILAGLGGRGRYWHRVCRSDPQVEIVAWVEREAENREEAIRDLELPEKGVFTNLSEALNEVSADFVIDVTPPAVHESIALTAFAGGLHVLGEKPLSDNFESARRIVASGKKAGRKHMITQNYRFEPLPRTTRRLLAENIIGEVGQLDVSLYVSWANLPNSHYVTEPYMFLTDMGIHHFDMMRYTLNLEPLSVNALTWNLPWGWHRGDACQLILFRFEKNVFATHRGIGCTVGHVPAGHNGEWRFEGPGGTLTWEGSKLYFTHFRKPDPRVRREIELDSAGGENPILREFISALEEDRNPECNAEDNLSSLAMALGAVKSAREGGEVTLSALWSEN